MSTASDLNRDTIELCNRRGGFVWRNNTGRRGGVSYGKRGSGDVIGVYHGYFISIETKTENDRPSDDQLDFVLDVREHGGFACFVQSIDGVIEFLDMIDEQERVKNGGQVIPF